MTLPAFITDPPQAVLRVGLKPQAVLLLERLRAVGPTGISQREAMMDLDMTSATLASRVSELNKAGYPVTAAQSRNPHTKRLYTRYTLQGAA